MKPSVNTRLRDAQIDHAVNLRQYSEGVLRRMIATLNRSDDRVMVQLTEALLRLGPENFTVERLDALLGSLRETNAAAYREVFARLEADMRDLAEVEALAQQAVLRQAIPVAVAVQFPIAAVSADQVYAAALARPFQGRLLKDWAANVEASRLTVIRNTIRAGVVEGRTTADIIRSIRGTKARGYADGALNRSRRELATVVQTALSHTAQVARTQFVKANDHLIKAEQWVSTLDTLTSPPCRIRDGLRYTPQTHQPIGHSIPWGAGPGAIHFGCRSVSVPITKSWRELGVDIDEIPESERASMDGQVPAETTYASWIKGQSASRQDEVLGPTRAALMREGKVSFPDFYDGKGRMLSLQDLKKRLP